MVACAALLSTLILSASATAQVSSAQQSAMRSNCRNDFMSLCSGVTPGGEEALGCLQTHLTSLSPGCKKVVGSTMHGAAPAAPAAAREAVAPAAPREQAPGGGGFVPGGILVDKACARYMLMHCRGFGFDSGRKIACLVDYIHSGHFVGPRCKAVLEMTGHLR